MPSTGSNRSSQENLLRTVYTDKIIRQFNAKSVLLQVLGRNERTFAEGKEISIPLHAAPGEGPIFNAAGFTPPASHEQIERATFNFRTMEQKIEIDQDFIEAAASPVAAEMSPLDLETKAVGRNGRVDLNFQLFGDGSAKLGQVATAPSATTLTVPTLRGLRNNQRVDIVLNATGSTGGGVVGAKITINRETKTLILPADSELLDYGEVHANAADYGIYKASSYMQAPFGLEAAISTGNPAAGHYGNVDRTLDANDFYRANVLSNSGNPRAPGWPLFQDMIDDIADNGEGETNLIIAGKTVWKHLAALLVNDKRYQGEKMTLNGWVEAIKFGSILITKDKHCDPTKAFFLDTTTWTLFQNNEGSFMDKDGAILARVEGKLAYGAVWYRRLQLVCLSPIANGVIEDLEYQAA